MGVLTVYLDKITGLQDEDTLGKSDPYVKFELEQDNLFFDKDYGEQKSSKKKDDLNPEYGETFEFEIPTLNNMVLTCKVMDDDPLFDDKIGQCKIKLEDMPLSEEPMGIDRVVDDNWFSKDAVMYLRLSYTE